MILTLIKRIVFGLTLLSFFVLLALVNSARAETVLSKQDAAEMFAMHLTEWIANVVATKKAGMGDYAKANEYEYTLYYQSPVSTVAVTPSYTKSNSEIPFKVTMTTVHQGFDATVMRDLSDEVLKDMIAGWHKQMLPEYTVMTNYEIDEQFVAVTFAIFQYGTIPEIDEEGVQSKGCWQNCIVRN